MDWSLKNQKTGHPMHLSRQGIPPKRLRSKRSKDTIYQIRIDASSCSNSIADEVNGAPHKFEDDNQPTGGELKELNSGTNNNSPAIFVNSFLSPNEQDEYFMQVIKYEGIFAWSQGNALPKSISEGSSPCHQAWDPSVKK